MRKPHAAICGALLAGCCSFCGVSMVNAVTLSLVMQRVNRSTDRTAPSHDSSVARPRPRRDARQTKLTRTTASIARMEVRDHLAEVGAHVACARARGRVGLVVVHEHVGVDEESLAGRVVTSHTCSQKAWSAECHVAHVFVHTLCRDNRARAAKTPPWTGTTKLFHKTSAHWGGSAHTHRLPHQ